MAEEAIFTRYKKTDDESDVLLMYLLLNGFDMSKVLSVSMTEEELMFGLKLKRIYGKTTEFVDSKKIEKEIEAINNPVICSPSSYEYYANANRLYYHTAFVNSEPLLINDMGIISKTMCITDDYVISSNEAKSLEEAHECGFTFFKEYVLRDEIQVGKWHIKYKNKVFDVNYCSTDDEGNKHEETLYTAIEVDKTSTYKMVIYIIKKTADDIDEWVGDNFKSQAYKLIK